MVFPTPIQIGSYIVPNSVTSIGWFAFSGCVGLTNISLPIGIGVIPDYSFYRCTSLTSIIIPVGVGSIGYLAFDGCSALTSVTIPNSVTTIYSAFSGCTGLLNLTIPDGVQRITARTFLGCNGLTNVFVSKSVSIIEESVFDGCTSLKTFGVDERSTNYASLDGVLFNKSQTKLVQYPAGKIGSYVIPDGITNIGNNAFFGSGSVASVTAPTSLAKIGDNAFRWCTNLMGVYFEGNAPSYASSNLFFMTTNVTVYYRAGTTGWSNSFAGRPTALWVEQPTYQEWAQTTGLLSKFPDASAETDDADQDGLNNLAEMLAGTDPTSPSSTLKFETTPRPNDLVDADKTAIGADQHALYFQTVPGKKYEIQSVSAIGGTWQMETNVTATQKRVVVNKLVDQSFYRVMLVP